MDTDETIENDNIDYVSDSCSESSHGNYNIESDEDTSDMDIGQGDDLDIDFSVPDVKANPPKWTDNIQTITVPIPKSKGGPLLPSEFGETSRPVDYFQLFFTDELISDIVKFTNKYAQIQILKKKRTQPNYVDKQWSLDGSDNVTVQEMRAYLGACVILSVNPSRQLRHVFSSEPYLNNAGLRTVFTLCRFSKISNYFCCSDKDVEPPKDSPMYDKLFKIRPVVETLQKLFPKYWSFGSTICIDESVITMKSKDSVKQFLPQKPSKWGWKVWSCCDSDSPDQPYLLGFIPYLGKKNTKVSKNGLYFDVVQELTKLMRGSNVRLYTDSAYTSLKTYLYLKKHSIFASGTC